MRSKGNYVSFTPLHNQNADFVGSYDCAKWCRLRISNAQWCKIEV